MAYLRARALCSFFGLLSAFVLQPFAAHADPADLLDVIGIVTRHINKSLTVMRSRSA
jgi:hypothetical protein